METTVAATNTDTKEQEKKESLSAMRYTDLQLRALLDRLEAELDANGGAFVSDDETTEDEKWDLYEEVIIRLDNLSEKITSKIDRTHYVIGKLSAEADAADAQKKALEKKLTKPLLARRKRKNRQVNRLKDGIIAYIDQSGESTIEGETCRYTIVERDNETVKPASRDVEEAPAWLTRRVIDEEVLEQALRGERGEQAQKEAQEWGTIETSTTRFLRVS
jgi:hypothetical protein